MDVAARWKDVVQLSDAELPLDEAALLISAAGNPGIDIPSQLERLDAIAAGVAGPEVGSVCRVLFVELGLQGDDRSYDDPLNSYIDRVLDRRLGIPISLGVLLIEVARRAGLRLEPVGMPGHFLVRDPGEPDLLIDPFQRGARLDHDGCERLMRSATGTTTSLGPGMLSTMGSHAVLSRMLANLDRSFERRRDGQSLRWVTELRMALPPGGAGDRLHLASRLSGMGRFASAALVLEDLAASIGDESTRARIEQEALSLLARLN